MPLVLEARHCARCDATTVHLRNGLNHAAHLVASILTGGLWLIVYGALALLQSATAYCLHCSAPQR